MSDHSNDTSAGDSGERWKPPFMAWWEGDFSGSFNVRKMQPLARLMYRSLLQQGWHSDRPPFLPNNDSDLMLMADAPSREDWEKHKESILERFKVTPDGRWLFHPKALREYDRALSEHVRKVAAGGQRWRRGGGQERTSPIAEQEDSASNPPGEQEDSNRRAPAPTSISTATPIPRAISTSTAISISDAEDSSSLDRVRVISTAIDGSDFLIEEICRTHPRVQKVTLTRQYIVSTAADEMKQHQGWTPMQALKFLLERTRLYRQKTDQWPDDQRRFIISSHEFFRTGEYRTDAKLWEKTNERGASKADDRALRNSDAIIAGLGLRCRPPASNGDKPSPEAESGRILEAHVRQSTKGNE